MKVAIVLLIVAAAVIIVSALPTKPDNTIVDIVVTDTEWESFKKTNNKSYADAKEEARRRDIYLETKRKIHEHNKKYEAGEVSFTAGINLFSDLTHEEYLAQCCNGVPPLTDMNAPGSSLGPAPGSSLGPAPGSSLGPAPGSAGP